MGYEIQLLPVSLQHQNRDGFVTVIVFSDFTVFIKKQLIVCIFNISCHPPPSGEVAVMLPFQVIEVWRLVETGHMIIKQLAVVLFRQRIAIFQPLPQADLGKIIQIDRRIQVTVDYLVPGH